MRRNTRRLSPCLLPVPGEYEDGYDRYNGYDNDNTESSNETNVSNAITNSVTNEEREQVAIALADGVPDSEIIKSVLKCGGAKYQEGKAKLEGIKKGLNQEEEDEDGGG